MWEIKQKAKEKEKGMDIVRDIIAIVLLWGIVGGVFALKKQAGWYMGSIWNLCPYSILGMAIGITSGWAWQLVSNGL